MRYVLIWIMLVIGYNFVIGASDFLVIKVPGSRLEKNGKTENTDISPLEDMSVTMVLLIVYILFVKGSSF